MGLTAVLALDCSYVHAHSVSIDKSVKRIGDKQRLLHESKLYYYREYLCAGPVEWPLPGHFGRGAGGGRFLTRVRHALVAHARKGTIMSRSEKIPYW